MNFKSYDSANIPSLDLNNIITIYYVCYKNCDNMEVLECISSLIFFGVLNMYLQWIYFCMYIIFYLFLLTLNVIISSPKCKLYVNGLLQNCIYFH